MESRTNPGDRQRIEVQFTHEAEVLVIDGLEEPPEDFGDVVARTLDAPDPDAGQRELEDGLGGAASVERVSRRPR